MKTTMLGIEGLEKTSPMFRAELWRIADRLKLDPSYIAAVMAHESGFNPQAVNPFSRATGLIQWMPTTAPAFGTTVDALASMTAEQQLTYVEKFFNLYKGRIRKDVPGDYMMAVFMPAFTGKDPSTVLFESGTKGYEQNKNAFDRQKKGNITIADVAADVDAIVARAQKRPLVEVDTSLPLGPAAQPSQSQGSASPSFSGPCSLPVLREGDRGSAVALWQRYLNKSSIVGTTVTVSGVFDSLTVEATRMYQAAKHLSPVDAIVGKDTWATVLHP